MDMCVGMAEVTAVRVALPAKFRRFPFEAGILLATESIKACSSDRFSLQSKAYSELARLNKLLLTCSLSNVFTDSTKASKRPQKLW